MEEQSFKIINGEKKIILSAPHCVKHKRNENTRPSETRTGVIARTIANKCKIYGIYKIKDELNDANWDRSCEYKKCLKELIKKEKIKVLLDIHGMARYREQDICIGINNGVNIQRNYDVLNRMIEIFHAYGFKNVTVDKPFSAGYEYCVSNYISRKCNIPTFQIEINLKYRSTKYKEYKLYKNLLESLEKIVEMLHQEL